MKRRRPDPRQGLFRWVWSDPDDERPDHLDDDGPPPDPPPLRGRVSQRHGPRALTLWGVPVTMAKAPGRPAARPVPALPPVGPTRGSDAPRGRTDEPRPPSSP